MFSIPTRRAGSLYLWKCQDKWRIAIEGSPQVSSHPFVPVFFSPRTLLCPPALTFFVFGLRQVLEKGGTGCVMRTLVARQTV